MTRRIAYMIAEKNIAPYNILAITFTKKATNEMRERVAKMVGDGAKYVNISTIHAIYEALKYHKCLTERIVTFSGEMLSNPQNILLKRPKKPEALSSLAVPFLHISEAL